MSLEQSIADLQTQTGLLLDLPQVITDEALAKITSITASYNARIDSMTTTFHINQTTGDDGNLGDKNLPLKSLEKALELTPRGGFLNAILQSDYEFSKDVSVDGKFLFLRSSSGVRRRLTFSRYQHRVDTTYFARCYGLRNSFQSHILFLDVIVELPDNSEPYNGLPKDRFSSPFGTNWDPATTGCSFTIASCDLDLPVTPLDNLFNDSAIPFSLSLISVTTVGSPLAGRLINGVSAGTASSSLPWLITNLQTL